MKSVKKKLQGMGAICSENGVGFRVWAPHADSVGVVGEFQGWDQESPLPLEPEEDGYWYGFSEVAAPGHEYKYQIVNGETRLLRLDPYARKITHSGGNGIVYDPSSFSWEGDSYQLPALTDIVIYECHLGTFAGDFEAAASKLRYLKALGFNVIELMPVTDFPGERSWGYNPAHIFSVETSYGGVDGLKNFVKEAHTLGIGVVLDVVYNHLGPDDLDLWNFDGSADDGRGGPYFYPDERAETPWGHTRPNYSSDPVRRFIRDNLMMWFEEYNIDGVRTDGTVYVRRMDVGSDELPDGWTLLQWLNQEAQGLDRWRLMIAEDLQNDAWLTKSTEDGGAGFQCQWDANFCHPVREMLSSTEDSDRSASRLAEILAFSYNGDPFQSILYTESHDEVANGSARMVSEIDPEDPESPFAVQRALLGIAIVLTSPGVPMLFQGQVRMQDGWFSDDDHIDWSAEGRDRESLRICRDFLRLRSGDDDRAPELRTRDIDIELCDEESGLLIVRRGEDNLRILFNLHNSEHTLSVDDSFEAYAATAELSLEDDTITLRPYAAVVCRGSLKRA